MQQQYKEKTKSTTTARRKADEVQETQTERVIQDARKATRRARKLSREVEDFLSLTEGMV